MNKIYIFGLIGLASFGSSYATEVNYAPYKDTSISFNWNTNVISTVVNGDSFPKPLLGDDQTPSQLEPGNKVVSLAFATGRCNAELWGGIQGEVLASQNLPTFHQKHMGYVISTGGAAGSFTCDSSDQMQQFLNRYDYQSPEFKGLDFDIEGGYTQESLKKLMKATANVQKQHAFPVSLTLATLAKPGSSVNVLGDWAIKAANDANLHYTVNLMVMDFGSNGCQTDSSGQCDMVKSAEFAAKSFSQMYRIPLSRIALTPMIGENDTKDEVVTIEGMKQIAAFVKANQLAGLHFWSFDRDRPCQQGKQQLAASPICNTQSDQPEAFNKAILSVL